MNCAGTWPRYGASPHTILWMGWHYDAKWRSGCLRGDGIETMKLPLTPIRCLYRAVDLYSRKLGVVSGSGRYNYGEFGERCERLAAGLRAEGIRPGDRVAFLSYNNNQLLEGYYGAPLLRAIAMPLNVRLTAAELVQILNHAEPAILVFENEFTLQAE